MDFRPYHVGANIPEQMQVDPEKGDLLETILFTARRGRTGVHRGKPPVGR